MLTIISPEQFTQVPWKNGLGHTLELAINHGATMDNFDWRLSIATVSQDGQFSNFSGYNRTLVLISGNGLDLTHDEQRSDHLAKLLQLACFDGGSHTVSRLHDGEIDDFNIMVNANRCDAEVITLEKAQSLNFSVDDLAFIYCLQGEGRLTSRITSEQISLPKGHLMRIDCREQQSALPFNFDGEMVILVKLKHRF